MIIQRKMWLIWSINKKSVRCMYKSKNFNYVAAIKKSFKMPRTERCYKKRNTIKGTMRRMAFIKSRSYWNTVGHLFLDYLKERVLPSSVVAKSLKSVLRLGDSVIKDWLRVIQSKVSENSNKNIIWLKINMIGI